MLRRLPGLVPLLIFAAVLPCAATRSSTSHSLSRTSSSGSSHRIYVDKSHQRLYAFDGTNLVMAAQCSTAAHHQEWVPKDHRYEDPSTPVGNYHISDKDSNHWSKLYGVHMLWSLFFDRGRAIHGTLPAEYHRLGRPASGGCVRLTRGRAEALYRWAHVGDPVYVVRSLPHYWSALAHQDTSRESLVQVHHKSRRA